LGSAKITVLGPVKEYDDPNNTSIVLRVDYGKTSFLFTGDAETQAENDILDAGFDVSATVLKVGHHGSETSTGYRWLRAVMPQYGVISCGTDNDYGHPHEQPLSRLRDADVQVYRTDLQGHIVCTSDGTTVSFTAKKHAAVTNPTEIDGSGQNAHAEEFIGNVNSKKFHLPTCSSLPSEKNRITFETYEEAVAEGYTPCGSCLK
jgi:competence protein ComEC